MSNTYPNPPLKEAVCTFDFGDTSEWDPTYQGLIYADLKSSYPTKKTATTYGVRQRKGEEKPSVVEEPRTRLFSEDENKLVQIGEHYLSVHRLAPYDSWDAFHKRIEQAYQAYDEVVAPTRIDRIRLSYINGIRLHSEDELNNFLKINLNYDEPLSAGSHVFFAGVATSHSEEDVLNVELSNSRHDAQAKVEVKLGITYARTSPSSVRKSVIQWMNKAHDAIEERFESLITDTLRDRFHQDPNR